MRCRILFGLMLFRAGTVAAQVPVTAAPVPVRADSVPAFERPNGALLRSGVLTYQVSLLKAEGTAVSLGTRTVTITDSPLGGVPSWLIVEARTGTPVPTLDSVVVNHVDMAAEHWAASIGPSQLAVSFTRDTAYGVLQNYQGRSSFVVGVPPNVLLSSAHGERLIEMLPLHDGYRAEAQLLVIGGATPTLLPAEIVVEQQEDAVVGTRHVPSWRVALRSGAIEARYWVSRDGTRVVRTEQALPDGMLVAVLTAQ